MPISIVDANLSEAAHGAGLVRILDEYARLPHIAGCGLSDDVQENLVDRLAATSGKQILLAVDGETVVGVAVCFEGFSTFAGRPLLNLHDLAVTADLSLLVGFADGMSQLTTREVESVADEIGLSVEV